MRFRHTAIVTIIAVFIAVAIIAGAVLALAVFVPLLSTAHTTGSERSGHISAYPAAWTDTCGHSATGNYTTENQIPSQNPSLSVSLNLTHVYQTIIGSPAFTAYVRGDGWVTIYWGLQDESGHEYAIGQFVLLSSNHPVDLIQGEYGIQTGDVKVLDVGFVNYGCSVP